MSSHLSTEPYKGVRDFYPSDWKKMNAMFATIRNTLSLWGYEEYNASPLERAEIYEAKTSEEIVNEQTYSFIDRGDRRVTLRPEMTPTLARMVAAKRHELAFPLRWFSIGNRFRYERPQKGRLREFYQADIDLVGLPEGEADLEIIQVASAVLRGFGAKDEDFVIRVNSRTVLNAACEAAGLSGEAVRRYLQLLDKKAKITPEEFSAALGALSAHDPLEFIDSNTMHEFVSTLNERGVSNLVFDPTITRGFDYYTGLVFEVYDTNPENPRALFGGGRYDRLVSLFGGESLPAIGFALGDVTLADFLETHALDTNQNTSQHTLYIGTPSATDIPAAQAFAHTLRSDGVAVLVNLTSRGLGDQIKDALKHNAAFFVAYGANEQAAQSVRLKTLAENKEDEISIDKLAKHIREQ